MRRVVDRERLLRFMHDLGREARSDATVYLTGGASALLFGWRATTIDIDMKIDPESNEILRALPDLKERYDLNIELASPDHFIPALPGWRERSAFIECCGPITFRHYDFYSQALSKLERGHARDTSDVDAMLAAGVIEPTELLRMYDAIEPELYRYPAITPAVFRRAVETYLQRVSG
ncbi:MAG: hypothetical protein QOH21_1023 [Acidobacteriota bacterium]|jgi:hypothetical protein|nr:hypothetical protein [Acidobacteriota bacterium]